MDTALIAARDLVKAALDRLASMRHKNESRAENRRNKRVRKNAEKLFGELGAEVDDPLNERSPKITVEKALEQGLRAILQKLNAAQVLNGTAAAQSAPVITCATYQNLTCSATEAVAFARADDQVVAVCPSFLNQSIAVDEFPTAAPSMGPNGEAPDIQAQKNWETAKANYETEQKKDIDARSAVNQAATLVHEFAHLVYGKNGLDIYAHDAAFDYLGKEAGLRDEAIVNPDSLTAFVLHAAIGGKDVLATQDDADAFMSGTMMSLQDKPARTEPRIGMVGDRKKAVSRSIAFAQTWLKVGRDSSRVIEAAFESLGMEPYSTWGDRECDVYDAKAGQWHRDTLSPVCRKWPPIRNLDDGTHFDENDSPDVIERKTQFWEKVNAHHMKTSAPGCPPPSVVQQQEEARAAALGGAGDCDPVHRDKPRWLRPFLYPQEPRWLIAAMRGDDLVRGERNPNPRVPGFSSPLDGVPVGDVAGQKQVAKSLAELYGKAIDLLNAVDVPGLARIFSLPKQGDVAKSKFRDDSLTVSLRAKSFMDLTPRQQIETFVDAAVGGAMESQRLAAMDPSASADTKALVDSIKGTKAEAVVPALPNLPS